MAARRLKHLQLAFYAALVLAVFLPLAGSTAAQESPEPADCTESADSDEFTSIVFLVRHAEPEYTDGEPHPKNPVLNEAGLARAEALHETLANVGLASIHSTDLYRTLQTAGPIARSTGLEIQIYDHQKLGQLAADLKATPGRHLVSGHSNTTPALVELLGGEPGEPIVAEKEFDRMYVLVLSSGQPVTTVQLRYGQPSER